MATIINKFKENRRAYYSFLAFFAIFFISLFSEFLANDKPILMYFEGRIYAPIFQNVTEKEMGGIFATNADFRDEEVIKLVEKNPKNWILFAPIRFSYNTINYKMTKPAPSMPSSENILGTDDQGRDVLARVLYGVRVSLLFGFALSFFSLVLAILIGAFQGYFGGKIDILGQRFIEIWSGIPVLFLLIILSSIITPGFFSLLFLMLLFSWLGLAGLVRVEFLRVKNFDFVLSARAIGASNFRIMSRHILPNASAVIFANLPFLISGSIVTLTSLDFLGLGLPAGSPSLGELLAQGKNNIQAYHLGIVGFVTISTILTLLVFIGEGARDSFDTRK